MSESSCQADSLISYNHGKKAEDTSVASNLTF